VSLHPSLRVGSVGARHRNVLKRFERIKQLLGEGKWDETKSAYNLPKVKSVKIKVKKTKEEKPKDGAAVVAAPAAVAAPKAGAAKAAAPAAKGAAPAAKAAAPKAAAPKGK